MASRYSLANFIRVLAVAMTLVVLGLIAWAALFPGHSPILTGLGQGYEGGGQAGAGNGQLPGTGLGSLLSTSLYLVLAGLVLLGIASVVRIRRRDND